MNPVQFIWVPLYLISAFIHSSFRNESFIESLFVVFAAFIIGLIVALGVYLSFKRAKWSWYQVLNVAAGVMLIWVSVVNLI